MGPLAVGTDGAGSIRIPSTFCGIPGFKPSFGRVPAYPLSPMGTVAHIGPHARCVDDLALMLTVMSRPDARDWTSLPYDPRDYRVGLADGVRGLRVAFSPGSRLREERRSGNRRCGAQGRRVVRGAGRARGRAGARLRQSRGDHDQAVVRRLDDDSRQHDAGASRAHRPGAALAGRRRTQGVGAGTAAARRSGAASSARSCASSISATTCC